MTTISHRELLNSSSRILERVRAGETITVTNNGEAAAILIPPSLPPLEQLSLSGSVKAARSGAGAFRVMPRAPKAESSAEVLADLRGDR